MTIKTDEWKFVAYIVTLFLIFNFLFYIGQFPFLLWNATEVHDPSQCLLCVQVFVFYFAWYVCTIAYHVCTPCLQGNVWCSSRVSTCNICCLKMIQSISDTWLWLIIITSLFLGLTKFFCWCVCPTFMGHKRNYFKKCLSFFISFFFNCTHNKC